MKKRLYLISGFIILGVIIIFTIDKLSDDNISDENKSSFFVWSTGDCNGIYNVIGLHTISAIGYTSNQSIYPVDSMNNEKYFNLTYPIIILNPVKKGDIINEQMSGKLYFLVKMKLHINVLLENVYIIL